MEDLEKIVKRIRNFNKKSRRFHEEEYENRARIYDEFVANGNSRSFFIPTTIISAGLAIVGNLINKENLEYFGYGMLIMSLAGLYDALSYRSRRK